MMGYPRRMEEFPEEVGGVCVGEARLAGLYPRVDAHEEEDQVWRDYVAEEVQGAG